MPRIARGEFTMGSLRFYPDKAPLSRVRAHDFWIDETPMTDAQLAAFVAATGHVTFTEIAPDPQGLSRHGSGRIFGVPLK